MVPEGQSSHLLHLSREVEPQKTRQFELSKGLLSMDLSNLYDI